MSITAFPVLARILEERNNLQGTALGTTAILCAAVDDVVAWSLLAFALAFIGGEDAPTSLIYRLTGLVIYLVLMLAVIRPVAAYLVRRQRTPQLTLELLGVIVAGALLSAAATDKIGVHPLSAPFSPGSVFPACPTGNSPCASVSTCWFRCCCCRSSSPLPACVPGWTC